MTWYSFVLIRDIKYNMSVKVVIHVLWELPTNKSLIIHEVFFFLRRFFAFSLICIYTSRKIRNVIVCIMSYCIPYQWCTYRLCEHFSLEYANILNVILQTEILFQRYRIFMESVYNNAKPQYKIKVPRIIPVKRFSSKIH